MAQDDWRIRIELPDEEGARGFLDRLEARHAATRRSSRDELRRAPARRLPRRRHDLRLRVDRHAGRAGEPRDRGRSCRTRGCQPTRLVTERWLDDEDRWDDEPDGPDVEEDLLERGYAPWEVRVECETLARGGRARRPAARAKASTSPARSRYVIAGGPTTASRPASSPQRVHGEVSPGGELVYEVQPPNPFAVFGGSGRLPSRSTRDSRPIYCRTTPA